MEKPKASKMAGQEQDLLDVHMQKRLIKSHLGKGMLKGQTWYLVESKWYKSFKQYVGMDEAWDITSAGDDHPGPIDNTPLLSDDGSGEIRDNLIDELDYVLVPEEAWQLLVKWYGAVSEKCVIPRKVVEFGVFVKHCKVEVYLLELRLCKDFRYEEEARYKFSKGDTIGKIESVMRKMFKIPDDAETRLWSCFTPNTFDELSKPESTVQDEGLFPNQLIVIETRNADGSWIRQPKRTITYTPATAVTMTDKAVATPTAVASASAGPSSIMPRYSAPPIYGYNERHQSAKPGLCGLCNLGNTCFMNSVIQCMSNCPPITKYFLNNEYFNELNEENPLGMKGEIAKAFGELIKTMWSGRHIYTVPHNFKLQVSKFAPQFCGYQQHDSQELLTFLLDGLHEDLNRIKKKPYIELRDADGRPDKEVAKEGWENYRKRNDSVIVDFFHGLLKSTVVCPECDKVSVTFDPFCYLSLPLPTKRERHMEVALFPFEDTKKPMNYKLILPKKGNVKDLVTHLGPLSGVNPENMIVTEVIKHHFHKIFTLNEPLDQIEERDSIFVYEVPPQNESQVTIPVYLWESSAKQPYSNNHLFGYPFFICIPKRDCTYGMLYDVVLKKLNRYLRVPDDNSTWWNGKSRKIPNGEAGFFESKLPIIENEESCSDSSECSNEDVMQRRIFSFYFVANTNSTSEVIKIHNDGNPIHIPGPIGKSYIVAKWLPKARELFYCEKAFEDSERIDKNKQNKLQKLQLRDCLELYTTKEKLGQDDAWYCPSCKKHQRATKKFDLWSLPRILIIHLKRFSYNRYRRDKIDTHVDFPLCGLNMSEYVINPNHSEAIYDLIGVCNHYGGMGGGHYTAYCQNQNDHKWYLFDDNSVSEVTEDTVVSNAAYVLFYMRRNHEEENMELN